MSRSLALAVTAAGLVGLAGGALGACSSDQFVVVTVQTRPAVHDATTLRVTVANGGATLSNDLSLTGHTFPVTFSMSAPGRVGDLAITVDALDTGMQIVGAGTITTTLDAGSAQVTLDSADFVVNTEYPMDQYLSDDFEAAGVQVAASDDQNWTVAFRDSCNTACNMFARRFDVNGAPVTTDIGAGVNQFAVTTELTDTFTTPAMAASKTQTLAFWDFHDETVMPTLDGVACRALDEAGHASAGQLQIATDAGTDVVSAVGLGNGKFVVTWMAVIGGDAIRSAIVGPDCVVQSGPVQVSPASTTNARRSHVAVNGNNLLYAWTQSGDLHLRGATTGNVMTTDDVGFLTHSATETVEHVRVAPLGTDAFAVAVRWSGVDNNAPGRIEVYRTSASGQPMGPPTLITDKSGSDFESTFAFGIASRADGAVLVTWHACGDNGDGQGCGVFARILRPTGAPVGDAFGVPTTILGDQRNPSAVGLQDAFAVVWNDMSDQEPDHSGLAVRARVIYPQYDDATSVHGSVCGDGIAPCASGLACAAGTDGARCYETCDANKPTPCPGGGLCTKRACIY